VFRRLGEEHIYLKNCYLIVGCFSTTLQQTTQQQTFLEDKFTRFTKLYILIFLMFLSIPVTIALIIGVFYGFSKIIASGPADIIFQLLIICLPPAVFSSAYVIFFKRTKRHPSSVIRICSYILFVIGLACSAFLLTRDIIAFFTMPEYDVADYRCFSIWFLAGNIGALFLIAIVQAFTTNKEKDWIEKAKEKGLE
jgi:hypothetical protein